MHSTPPRTFALAVTSIIAACSHATTPQVDVPIKAEPPQKISAAEKAAVLKLEDRSLDLVLAEARASGKAVLIELTADWCAACKAFEQRVLENPKRSVVDALSEVIWVRYDVETEAGKAAARAFPTNSLPAFIVLDAEGTKRGGCPGAPLDPAIFVDIVQQSVQLGSMKTPLAASSVRS